MSYERAKYEFPIDGIAHHEKAEAPTGIYLLDGCWHMAAHDSVAELQLLAQGALLIATLTFTPPARPSLVAMMSPWVVLQSVQLSPA
jgi:hypothetical protein